ncbi:MAG TPA: acyl-CoA thioesterase [Thermoanaerobaculia bacterium]|nr:acyl-CoA thioesterase [Thermoanaerobaculia bacterium]
MVVLLRLLKALIAARFAPKLPPLGESAIHMRVWPNDLDLNMHVNSGRYLSFMDIGRVELLARFRVFRKSWKLGWRPINGGTMISYRKSLLPWERFTVKTRVVCWDEKWFYFEHRVERGSGELAALANARGLLRGRDGNISPSAVFELAGSDPVESPPMPEAIRLWSEAEAAR